MYISHSCVVVQNIVGLDDGLAPDQRQAIIQTNNILHW